MTQIRLKDVADTKIVRNDELTTDGHDFIRAVCMYVRQTRHVIQ